LNNSSNSATHPAPSTQSFAALRNRGYRGFFFTSAGTMMADSVEHVISYWVIFEKFKSPALGGFAVVSHWLPFLLFSVYAGALSDRYDPRRLIQIGMGLFMFVSVAWGVLILTDTLEIWHAMVLLVLHGIAGVFWNPPAQTLLHDIVEPPQLQSAVRLMATSRYLGLLLGPAVGAGIMWLMGPAYGLFFNALLYWPAMLWLWRAPYGPRFRKTPLPVRAVRGLKDIVTTLRDVATHPIIMPMTLLGGGASLFIGNAYQAQMPGFAHDLGHLDADISYSALLAADAIGALMAGFVLESRSLLPMNPRTACVLALLWCGALFGFATSTNYLLALVLLFAAGFFELSFSSMTQTLVQMSAPAEIRGRVIGLYSMAAFGMRTFSGVTVGVVGGFIGIHYSLALSALILAAVVATLLSLAVRPRAHAM
jgi:MFS family permease